MLRCSTHTARDRRDFLSYVTRQKNANILLLLQPHGFNFGFDFIGTTAQRELLQQVEVLRNEFLLLLKWSKYLNRGKECSEDTPFSMPRDSVVAKWVSDGNMIGTLLIHLKPCGSVTLFSLEVNACCRCCSQSDAR